MKLLITLIATISLFSCTHKSTQENEKKPSAQASWAGEMQGIEDEMLFLLEKTANVEKFKNAKASSREVEKIKKSFETLKRKSMSLENKKMQPDKDPTLAISARIFKNNVDLAADSFFTANYDFSKSTLRSALGQCVQCHTRLEYGPQFQKEKWTKTLADSSSIDQIQILIATRNFQMAEAKLEDLLKSDIRLTSPFAWQDIIQIGFLLNVRFNNDPLKTKKLISFIESSSQVPLFLKKNVPYWNQSVQDWHKILPSKNKMVLADRLIAKGDHAQSESRGEGGLIYYLLASRILHEEIAFFKEGPKKTSEILYRLGLINSIVNDRTSQSMYEDYFELCIKDSPKTDIAKKCYTQLERNLLMHYTGRLEKDLPFDIKNRLNELSKLVQ